jgi:hypothetical protein
MDTMRAAYDEVYAYTMGRPGFILQHVVDAFAVQTANDNSRPISVVLLWLAFISNWSGSFRAVTFEVASVKVSPPVLPNERVYFGPPRGGPGTPDPTQITWSYATLRNLLMTAYDVKAYQISGPE